MTHRIITFTAGLATAIGIATVGAGAAHAAAHPNLVIRINHSSFVAGQSGVLSIHLGGPGGGQQVNVSETRADGQSLGVTGITTDANSNATLKVPMAYNAFFTVQWAGNADWSADTARTGTVRVAAYVLDGVEKSYKRAGQYHLVHRGKKGELVTAVVPAKPGEKITDVLQVGVKGKWHTINTRAYKLRTETVDGVQVSVAGATFTGTPGRAYRLRSVYGGDRLNTAHASSWIYVKFA